MNCSISTHAQTSLFALNQDTISPYSFNAKEKDYESGFHYYGARYYDSEVLTGWLSVDPMADKYPSITPYSYCSWNPVILVDPDGKKDKPFRKGIDKAVFQKKGTETPIYVYNNQGKTIGLHPNYKNAYNCHSYTWHNSLGDPTPGPGDIPGDGLVPKWDNNPADDIVEQGAVQLGTNDNNIPGDRIIYYSDENGNGIYDDGEFIAHSAIVKTVDEEGYTSTVISKMGQGGISENHPCAPGYYDAERDPETGKVIATYSRAYFRKPSKDTIPSNAE